MFNQTKIADLAYNFVGMRDIDASSPLADPTKSIFIDDISPVLTYDNIINVLPQKVTDEEYAELLESKFKSYVRDVLSKVTTLKKVASVNRDVLDRMSAFTGIGRDTVINRGKFVGWMVALKKGKDTVLTIKEIGLQASSAQTNLKIYVYHSSQTAPIATRTISTTKGGSFQWVTLTTPIELSYYAEGLNDYDTGGFFYIGYHQDDLVGNAIMKSVNFINPPCSTCDGGRYFKQWSSWSKFMSIEPAEIDITNGNPPTIEDITRVATSPPNNYGLNFSFFVKCDLTKFIEDQLDLLVEPIKYAVAVGLLKEMVFNTRNNVPRDTTMALAHKALYGDMSIGQKGIQTYYDESIKALDFDLSRLSSVCMGQSKNGVRHSSI
jgi:hypothetical protein